MSEIKIEQAGLTDIGNVRKGNEDSFGFVESIHGPLFTVCDGMGGHVGGATASQIAVKCILEYISSSNLASPSVEINNAIVVANQEILDAAHAHPELKGMGTTCTVLLVTKDSIHIGYVGDSRIYVLSDNRLYRITKDHSFVQTLVDAGVISDSEAESHPRKNELTRALGVRQVVEPTISQQPITPKKGDVFMLCSDGLCGLVNDSSMQEILTKNYDLNAAAQELINAAKNAGGHDNITVQLLRVTESPYQRSSFPDFSPKENLSNTMVQTPNMEMQIPAGRTGMKFNKMQLIVASLIFVILILGTILTVDSFSEKNTNKKDVKIDSAKITTVIIQPEIQPNVKVGLLPGDTINGIYLGHLVSHGEVYSKIKEKRLNNVNYKDQFDFSIVYNHNHDKIPTNKQGDLDEGKLIWWERKTNQSKVVPTPNIAKIPAANTTTTPKDVPTNATPTTTTTNPPVEAETPQQSDPCLEAEVKETKEIAKATNNQRIAISIADNILKDANTAADLLQKEKQKTVAKQVAKDQHISSLANAQIAFNAAIAQAKEIKEKACKK